MQQPGHHLVYGSLRDYLTGEELPDTDDERLRQQLARLLVEEKGFAKAELEPDLKPSNVMLGEHGEVLVVDWGLAKVLDRTSVKTDSEAPLSRVGQILGTPGYMPPEQAGGEVENVGPLADVYSVFG